MNEHEYTSDIAAAGHTLAARLVAIGTVGAIDGHDVIRRESVMEFVTRWRISMDEASKRSAARSEKNMEGHENA